MRSRDEIIRSISDRPFDLRGDNYYRRAMVEILLDIRDLLQPIRYEIDLSKTVPSYLKGKESTEGQP